jgi:hypothetical protein
MEPFEQKMIEQGLMISCKNVVSEDGLRFTRTAEFPNEEAFTQVKLLIDDPAYEQNRIEYNSNNLHVFFSTDEVIE